MNIVALIPARGGSQRIPRKNIKSLGGKPLIHWTIEAARESGIFSDVFVSTEDREIAGAVPEGTAICWRPQDEARDDSPDIDWVYRTLMAAGSCDAFMILRPTSPFRTAETIRRASAQFQSARCDSMRAVEPVKEHPGKHRKYKNGIKRHRLMPLFG